MTKKHFIALADAIIAHNKTGNQPFTSMQQNRIADFLRETNPRFNEDLWLSYIAGECGSNGGKLKKSS